MDVEKSSQNKPFSPTAQTAKNITFVIVFVECTKLHVLHSKKQIKKEDLKEVIRILSELI